MIDPVGTTPGTTNSISEPLKENQVLGQDAFLNLLLVQLQNQDPMDPVKNEDFLAQLAQFSSLEQLQSINKAVSGNQDIEATQGLRQAIDGNTAVALIGKGVEIPTDTVTYTGDGSVDIGYNLAGPANRVDLRIFDTGGNLVRSLTETSPEVGNGLLTWDGKNADGQRVQAGTYTIVPVAVNGQGSPVMVSAALTGKVTGVRYQDGNPILVLDGGEAPLSGVAHVF